MTPERFEEAKQDFVWDFGKDVVEACLVDVTNVQTIEQSFMQAALRFGGIDIIVNNACLSISKTEEVYSEADWDLLYDVLVKGQFLVTQKILA